jgi:hypothetical protein
MIAVHVNGRPLPPGPAPVVERSNVLLPARAVFQALGAIVEFEPRAGRIVVRRGLHFLSVTQGSRQAYVDNTPVTLDVAPFERGSVTYLPLRFVAEGLGGRVRYFPRRNVVDIEDTQAPGSSPARAIDHALTAPRPSAGGLVTIDYRRPAPGEFVTGGFPAISALFRSAGRAAEVTAVQLFLDGQDVSHDVVLAPGAIGYTPGNALGPGMHQVAIRATDASGHSLSSVWTFADVPVSTGAPPGVRGYQSPAFSLLGTPPGGAAPLQFGLATTVPGSGYVTLCGYSRQYPLLPGNDGFHYYATVKPPAGLFAPACQASAYFTDRNGSVNLFTLATPLSIDTRPTP